MDRLPEPLRRFAGLVERVADGVLERDLLSYASAISFQVIFAIVPAILAALALLGFLGLEDVWSEEVRPTVQDRLPEDAFAVVDRTVDQILGERRGTWLTFGLLFALWQLSGAVRTVTGPLNMVYETDEDRSWARRMAVSILVSLAIVPCLLLAVLGVTLGDELLRELDLPGPVPAIAWIVRWGLAVALMGAAIWLLLRFAPAASPGWAMVGIGSGVVVGGWLLATLGYAWYLDALASYGSLFAGLASIVVLMTYVYLLALVFLVGVQLDALLRERLRDERPAGS